MIGRTNTGGGGGLQDTDALLRVQAPAGSVVTITKGGMTKTDHGHENALDPTVYDYYFIIHQSQFDGVNPWTVTATNGGSTANTTIIIDSPDEYDVTLSYIIYLIKDGTYVDGVTWTRYGNSAAAITQQTGFLRAAAGVTPNSNVSALYATNLTYPLGGLTTLHFKSYKGDGTHYGQSRSTDTVPAIGISTSIPTINSGNAVVSGWDAFAKITISNNYVANEEYTLDVSNFNNSAYISFSVGSTSGFTGALYLRDIWLD